MNRTSPARGPLAESSRRELDALPFAQQLEHRAAHGAAMEEVLRAALVTDEPKALGIGRGACVWAGGPVPPNETATPSPPRGGGGGGSTRACRTTGGGRWRPAPGGGGGWRGGRDVRRRRTRRPSRPAAFAAPQLSQQNAVSPTSSVANGATIGTSAVQSQAFGHRGFVVLPARIPAHRRHPQFPRPRPLHRPPRPPRRPRRPALEVGTSPWTLRVAVVWHGSISIAQSTPGFVPPRGYVQTAVKPLPLGATGMR